MSDKKVKIEVTERDLKMLMNIPVFFKKGTFPLNGTEVIVCAQTQEYLGALINLIKKELSEPPKSPLAKVEEKKEPVKEEKGPVKKKVSRKPRRKAIVKED